jgi:uncharacterized integral membrane protein
VTVPVAVVAVVFAVSNRPVVAVTFWPMPIRIEAPLYLVVLLAALIGFLAGELIAWIGGARARRASRNAVQRIAVLERELAASQTRIAAPPPPTPH